MKSYEDFWTMFQCVRAASRLILSEAQIDWLCDDRARANYFDACMKS